MSNPSSKEPNQPQRYVAQNQPKAQPGAAPRKIQERPQPQQAQHTKQAPRKSGKKIEKVSFYNHRGRLNKKQANIIICSVIGLIILLLLLAVLLPGGKKNKDASSSSLSQSLSLVTESGYDKDKNKLATDAYATTILEKTEDAGAKYVEETLFLGDSNTVRMTLYSDVTNVTLKNGIGVEGMGVQAVPTLKSVQFRGISNTLTMPEAVTVIQPKRIVITFGTNNAGGMSASNFAAMYKTTLDAVHKAYPYADIIIGAVPPIDRYHMNEAITMTTIDEFNLALVKLAEEEGYKFLNWSEALKDSSSGFCKSDYTIQDGIHLSRTGMEALFGYMRTHSFITKDKRPALKPVPERIGYDPGIIKRDPDKYVGSLGPPSSSSSQAPSSSSSQVKTVTVVFAGAEGGTVSAGNATVAVGNACPAVTAYANEGFTFSHWESTLGGLGTSATLSGFVIPLDYASGDIIYVTAFFKAGEVQQSSSEPPVEQSSSQPAPPPVESQPQPPSSLQPPVTEPEGTSTGPEIPAE